MALINVESTNCLELKRFLLNFKSDGKKSILSVLENEKSIPETPWKSKISEDLFLRF